MCAKNFLDLWTLCDQNFFWDCHYKSATQPSAVPGGLSGNESPKRISVNAPPTAAPTELAILYFSKFNPVIVRKLRVL